MWLPVKLPFHNGPLILPPRTPTRTFFLPRPDSSPASRPPKLRPSSRARRLESPPQSPGGGGGARLGGTQTRGDPDAGPHGGQGRPGVALTLLSCWWMSCFSSEAFSGGSDMLGPAPRRRLPPLQGLAPRGALRPASEPQSGLSAEPARPLASRGSRGTPRRVRRGAGREARGWAGGEAAAAAAAAPNCCFETAADRRAAGLSPALPDRLHRPFPAVSPPSRFPPHDLSAPQHPVRDPLPAVAPSLAGPSALRTGK